VFDHIIIMLRGYKFTREFVYYPTVVHYTSPLYLIPPPVRSETDIIIRRTYYFYFTIIMIVHIGMGRYSRRVLIGGGGSYRAYRVHNDIEFIVHI